MLGLPLSLAGGALAMSMRWSHRALFSTSFWLVLSLLTATQVYIGWNRGDPVSFGGLFLQHLLAWLPWVPFALLVLWFGFRFPFERSAWRTPALIHVLLSICVALLHSLAVNLLLFFLEDVPLTFSRFSQNYVYILAMAFHQNILLYWAILSTGYAVNHYAKFRESKGADPSTSKQMEASDGLQSGHVDRLVIKDSGRVVLVKVDDIDWIEAADYYVQIHAGEAVHLLRETMTQLEGKLPPEKFVRIHRSAIVNLERIQELQSQFRGEYVVVLQDGTRLKLSRSRRAKLQEVLRQPL